MITTEPKVIDSVQAHFNAEGSHYGAQLIKTEDGFKYLYFDFMVDGDGSFVLETEFSDMEEIEELDFDSDCAKDVLSDLAGRLKQKLGA